MKRIISILCTMLILCLSLTACQDKPSEGTGGQAPSGADINQGTEVTYDIGLEDGVYTVDVDTGSSMFHLNETANDKGKLTVKKGKATLHITLVSKNIVNLFVGEAEDAKQPGAKLIEPTLDVVTYSDGTTEEVYGFDIPVEQMEFDVSIIGTHGNWYTHRIIMSNPVKAD